MFLIVLICSTRDDLQLYNDRPKTEAIICKQVDLQKSAKDFGLLINHNIIIIIIIIDKNNILNYGFLWNKLQTSVIRSFQSAETNILFFFFALNYALTTKYNQENGRLILL